MSKRSAHDLREEGRAFDRYIWLSCARKSLCVQHESVCERAINTLEPGSKSFPYHMPPLVLNDWPDRCEHLRCQAILDVVRRVALSDARLERALKRE